MPHLLPRRPFRPVAEANKVEDEGEADEGEAEGEGWSKLREVVREGAASCHIAATQHLS
ncbi:MAG: hypothetical protein ACKESB_01980 [Candidatus Hodgkinia cicadicola]